MLIFLSVLACDVADPSSAGSDDGCQDGEDIGYTNGLIHGESCIEYDDDPGTRSSEDGDAYEEAYNAGYIECYPEGYAEGYDEGSAGC